MDIKDEDAHHPVRLKWLLCQKALIFLSIIVPCVLGDLIPLWCQNMFCINKIISCVLPWMTGSGGNCFPRNISPGNGRNLDKGKLSWLQDEVSSP